PTSSCSALGFRLTLENSERTPCAGSRADGYAVSRSAAPAARLTAQPPSRLAACLVEALDIGPRKVSRDDLAVVLTRAGPTYRAPLTEPDTVAPPHARGDEPAHLTGFLRHRHLERRAPEELIGLRPQHRAHIRTGNPHLPVLERDAQLTHATRRRRAGHGDVGDTLEPTSARVHHRGKRPRQYSAQLCAVPFLAPPKPR